LPAVLQREILAGMEPETREPQGAANP